MNGATGRAVLGRMGRKGLTEKAAFKQRLGRGEGMSHEKMWERSFPGRGVPQYH